MLYPRLCSEQGPEEEMTGQKERDCSSNVFHKPVSCGSGS